MAIWKIEDDRLLSCTLEESDEYCVTTPKGVRIIESNAFKDCSELESLTLGEDVEVVKTDGLQFSHPLTELIVTRPLTLFESHSSVGFGFNTDYGLMKVRLPFESLREAYSAEPIESVENCLSESLQNLLEYANHYYGVFVVEGMFLTTSQMQCCLLVNRLLGLLGEEDLKTSELSNLPNIDSIFHAMMIDGLKESLEESAEEFRKTAELYVSIVDRSAKVNDFVSITEENCESYGFDKEEQQFKKKLPAKVRIDMPLINNTDLILSPRGLREIEFSAKVKITDFTFLDNVGTIERIVFPPCESLKLPNSLPKLKSIVVPPTVHSVSHGCGLTGLRELILPESLLVIEPFSFRACYSLETLTLPKSLEILGNYGFEDCISLRTVKALGGKIIFDFECFRNCKSIREVSLKMNVILKSSYLLQSKFLERVELDSIVLERESMKFFNSQFKATYSENFLKYLRNFIGIDQIVVAQGSKGEDEPNRTLF